MMHIHLGADHGGYQLKEAMKTWLTDQGYAVTDHGNHQIEPQDDYPEFAFKVAQAVVADADSLGLLFCRSGGGMAIAANKVAGARAVMVDSERTVRRAITDDHANILTIQADWSTETEAQELLKIALNTSPSSEPRHARRVAAIHRYETRQA